MSNGEILHITKDEKFIDGAYYLFEKAFPNRNRFVVLKPPADPPIRYLNKKLVAKAEFKIISRSTIKQLADRSSEYSVTVLHGLNNEHALIYSSAVFKDRFMGIIHGGEIYNSGLMDIVLMGDETKKLYQNTSQTTFIERAKNLLRKIKYRNHKYPKQVDLLHILYQMQVFGSLPGISYQKYINEKIYNPFVQHIPFSYYPIDFIISDKDLRVQGKDILLGNSASATNNHLEAFELLSSINLGDRKIITPLSYGSEKYAKAIVDEGQKLFGDQFVPLNKFLPIDEYNRVISHCGIVIMNHYRPQAMGNIIAALYMGAKVFLNTTNVYEYFKGLGCHIFLIDEDLTSQKKPFELLSSNQVMHNRAVLEELLSTAVLVEEMRKAFKDIFDYNNTLNQQEVAL
ncbi:TDP-N-acetylfucosamine:lipid II N-acetylfucosaminyltransferase [Fodinibius sp. Rm-B-1B1-1]|uniref:TDP-N-acetylfucosamine:lipid II N-acetylfucosaminyltransferase n=1 Tax=Fodinibius alkaliphilus TaxID=3140241 RepID=UPI00315A6F53